MLIVVMVCCHFLIGLLMTLFVGLTCNLALFFLLTGFILVGINLNVYIVVSLSEGEEFLVVA